MKTTKNWIPALLAAGALLFSLAPARADEALKAAIAGPQRMVGNVARDPARHPYETLSFFGIKPTQTVVELTPGAGGWYTEILAPYLRERGTLILGGDDPASASAYNQRSAARLKAKLDAQPGVYDKVKLNVFDAETGKLQYAAPASVDLVLTFRNVHNWVQQGEAKTLAVFKSAYEVLKPGGVLGVVDHRRPVSQPQDEKAKSGYLHQAYVIAMAERAGFKLAATSEINANPRDTADHEGGVWSLPPTYGLKDKDRTRYEAIGESDRMTLKFVKP
ncbi:class I SAM-dependent methyltransferase [Roseateles violae]|uniref:Methyltransferase domain-containing protein n=1 Tax=Roseateles violae TaxID=3058042 RepID=A0ABT8DXD5_9BURK|nr:methyltransferase domain-containing protein [Pelomonas sp. PFR6]MDN3921226.1 methyltransferase domain-containing protein [Pelomonas sp. PFR6]